MSRAPAKNVALMVTRRHSPIHLLSVDHEQFSKKRSFHAPLLRVPRPKANVKQECFALAVSVMIVGLVVPAAGISRRMILNISLPRDDPALVASLISNRSSSPRFRNDGASFLYSAAAGSGKHSNEVRCAF